MMQYSVSASPIVTSGEWGSVLPSYLVKSGEEDFYGTLREFEMYSLKSGD